MDGGAGQRDPAACQDWPMKRIAVLAVFMWTIALLPTRTSAQTSQEYAAKGPRLWAAFECASLAVVTGNAAQNQRLFKLGYEQGKIFLNALQSGKVKKE